MKRLALLTVCALALPGAAAFASPHAATETRVADRTEARVHFGDRPVGDVTVRWNRERYDRYDRSRWSRERHRWEPLAMGQSARNQRQFINVGGPGRYRKLRIEGVRGEPVILKIAIEFADRTTQAVDYRESLPRGTGEVIDLNGGDRRINRIIVYTDPSSRGSYSVYGA